VTTGVYNVTTTRYLSNGNLDLAFGINGMVTTSISGNDDSGRSLLLQPDGKIIVAGETSLNPPNSLFLIRYNTDGTLDNSFGSGGIVTTTIGINDPSSPSSGKIALQGDGKIVLNCNYKPTNSTYASALIRYNANGTLDNSFGTAGISSRTLATSGEVKLQPDGKILVTATPTTSSNGTIMRFSGNGNVDNTFGTAGMAVSTASLKTESILLQPDNKMVLAGWFGVTGTGSLALVRFNDDGTIDNTFGNGGFTILDIKSGYDIPKAIKMQADGKIVIAGTTSSGSTGYILLARFDSGLASNGIKELEYTKMNLSPNPSSDKIKLEFENGIGERIEIINSIGELVYSDSHSRQKQEIDISLLPTGIYFVEVQSQGSQMIFKVIKE
jgi:uncharacterized delta-60 repeat protein